MARRDDFGTAMVWFFLGAAVGAGVALLYAPQSGRATRKYLGYRAEEGRDKVNEAGREVVEKGRELYEKGREVADEVADIFDRGRKLVGG